MNPLPWFLDICNPHASMAVGYYKRMLHLHVYVNCRGRHMGVLLRRLCTQLTGLWARWWFNTHCVIVVRNDVLLVVPLCQECWRAQDGQYGGALVPTICIFPPLFGGPCWCLLSQCGILFWAGTLKTLILHIEVHTSSCVLMVWSALLVQNLRPHVVASMGDMLIGESWLK